jgi:hypothetical protein
MLGKENKPLLPAELVVLVTRTTVCTQSDPNQTSYTTGGDIPPMFASPSRKAERTQCFPSIFLSLFRVTPRSVCCLPDWCWRQCYWRRVRADPPVPDRGRWMRLADSPAPPRGTVGAPPAFDGPHPAPIRGRKLSLYSATWRGGKMRFRAM